MQNNYIFINDRACRFALCEYLNVIRLLRMRLRLLGMQYITCLDTCSALPTKKSFCPRFGAKSCLQQNDSFVKNCVLMP